MSVLLFNPTAILFIVNGAFVHLNILFVTADFLVLFWCSVMSTCEEDRHFKTKLYRLLYTYILDLYNNYEI
jgi:hypothetical protein